MVLLKYSIKDSIPVAQILSGFEAASFEKSPNQDREPDLHLIEPGSVLGSIDETNTMGGIFKKLGASGHGFEDAALSLDAQILFDD